MKRFKSLPYDPCSENKPKTSSNRLLSIRLIIPAHKGKIGLPAICACVLNSRNAQACFRLKCRSKLPHFKYQKLEFPAMEFRQLLCRLLHTKNRCALDVLFDTASLTLTRSS